MIKALMIPVYTHGKNGNWQYYNSDYYYKTESAFCPNVDIRAGFF